jgi:hypothetical protein
MKVQREPASITVWIGHADFRRLLENAWKIDEKYCWLRQHDYVISLAIVDDRGVTLTLPPIATC